MREPFEFVAGGTLPPDSPSYIERAADRELLRLCLQGEFAYVLSSRQMGKSSLLERTRRALAERAVLTPYVDLTEIGSQRLTAEQWYFGVLSEIQTACTPTIDLRRWWSERMDLPLAQRFSRYFSDVLLHEVVGRIVIFIDEIDSTLGLEFTDDFFASIRASYNRRAQQKAFGRLSFVLVGVATPTELIRDRSRTPFNIGQRVDVTDFTREEAAPLVTNLGLPAAQVGLAADQILHWTGGQPYLTQRLCLLLAKAKCDVEDIGALVGHFVASELGREDPHFQFIEDYLRSVPIDQRHEMLDIYAAVLDGEAIACLDASAAHSRLRLAGIVKRVGRHFALRSEIYRRLFDSAWLTQQRRDLAVWRSSGIEGDLSGKILRGRYRLVRRIGEGAISEVYLAEHCPDIGARFALKLLKQKLVTESDFGQRFHAEASVLERFEHPGIVRVYETFVDAGSFCMVSAFVDGESLSERLERNGAMDAAVALPMFMAILDALDHAHSKGVVHRDLKPSNILISADGRPLLSDFGIARFAGQRGVTANITIGTPQYLSPEQILLRTEIDHRSDLYSAGIVLHEMLTGAVPFRSDDFSDFEIMRAQVQSDLPDPRLLRPNLAAELVTVLGIALAKEPGRRYQSGEEFRLALEHVERRLQMKDPNDREDLSGNELTPIGRLRRYGVYAHASSGSMALRVGFSWPAICFGVLWLLKQRLYGWATICFIGYLVVGSLCFFLAIHTLGESEGVLERAFFIAAVSINILIGMNGNRWLERALLRDGYLPLAEVLAPNATTAVARARSAL